MIRKGVNFVFRKLAKNSSSTVQLIKEDDNTYTFRTELTFHTTSIQFVPNEEFMETTIDGRKIKCCITFEGNKMVQQQSGDHAIRIEREFFEDEMITKLHFGDVVATRWFQSIH